MQLFYGVPEDIEKWMSLVTQVRWNFPGLETQEKLNEHRTTVLKFMGKQQAICVKEGNEIAGVMLFSRGHNMICCLAVSPDYRRRGVASMVFKWADGDCMGRMYPAAHRRFMQLPVNDRLAVFSDILSFLECVASRNYVAIDFYDGSIMYDFANGKTTICDIDLFRKQPCVNDMGRMWGSSRFQSPEEYQLGAAIDEVTNVYTLGATAFALFGEYNRTREKWQLSDKLFEIATRAVSDDRANRQQTIRQFTAEWEATLAVEK